MTNSAQLPPADEPALRTNPLRLAAAAYLARFTALSRTHAESDLRIFLAWCAERGVEPLAAGRAGAAQVEVARRRFGHHGRRPGRLGRRLARRPAGVPGDARRHDDLQEPPLTGRELCDRGYGYGMELVIRNGEVTMAGHGGLDPGVSAMVAHRPAAATTIVVACNHDRGTWPVNLHLAAAFGLADPRS
jgi:hypothetical protein